MRKTSISIVFFAILAVVLASCNLAKSQQERIIGKWHYSNAGDKNSDTIPVEIDNGIKVQTFTEISETFKADKQHLKTGVIRYEISIGENQSITLVYKINYAGTWEIKDETLLENPADATFGFAGMTLSHPDNQSLQQYAKAFKADYDDWMSNYIQYSALAPDYLSIVRLDDNELVISSGHGPNRILTRDE